MKVSKRDISIVMVLLGLIALFCVYQFNYTKAVARAEELQKEIDVKKKENEELLKIDEQKLESEMKKCEDDLIAMVKKYPSYYRFDDMIMYLYDLEHVSEYGAHFITYKLAPSSMDIISSYVGKFRDKSVMYSSSEASFKMTFTNDSYVGCKKMLSSIFAEKEHKVPKNFASIRIRYDNVTGEVRGEIEMHAYCVTDYGTLAQTTADTNYPQAEVIIPPVTMGVDCVFGPTVSPTPTLEEWQAMQGFLNPELPEY